VEVNHENPASYAPYRSRWLPPAAMRDQQHSPRHRSHYQDHTPKSVPLSDEKPVTHFPRNHGPQLPSDSARDKSARFVLNRGRNCPASTPDFDRVVWLDRWTARGTFARDSLAPSAPPAASSATLRLRSFAPRPGVLCRVGCARASRSCRNWASDSSWAVRRTSAVDGGRDRRQRGDHEARSTLPP